MKLRLGLFVQTVFGALSPADKHSLDQSQFNDRFILNGEPSLLFFTLGADCGPCQTAKADFDTVGSALKGLVQSHVIQDQNLIKEYNIQVFPTVAWIQQGKLTLLRGRKSPEEIIEFAWNKAQDLVSERFGKPVGIAQKEVEKEGEEEGERETSTKRPPKKQPKRSSKTTDSSSDEKNRKSRTKNEKREYSSAKGPIDLSQRLFKDVLMKSEEVWFVKFYAPWCGHCKALAPVWNDLAKSLGETVRIAKVDATIETELAQEFGIKGYPTLLLFPAGKKGEPIPYNDARDLEPMRKFAAKFALKSLRATQLTSNEQFEKDCSDSPCLIALLPHILDSSAKERKGYLKVLKDIMAEDPGLPMKYMWTEASNSVELERALRLEFGWPAVIIINQKKSVYATHTGPFTKPDLLRFITGVPIGRVASEKVPPSMPKWPKLTKWDGKDAPTEPPANEELRRSLR